MKTNILNLHNGKLLQLSRTEVLYTYVIIFHMHG